MSAALQEQQRALLQALWRAGHDEAMDVMAPHVRPAGQQWQRGLKAYRSNGHALAQRALAGAYPVVRQLLGEGNFLALALGLWHRHPPERGDVAQWGEALAAHIESLPELNGQEPYLADVARVEWLLHRAATVDDAAPDPASFQLLAQQDPRELSLVLSAGAVCLASPYPIVSIINAHLDNEPALEEAGKRLRARACETALVWRQGFKPRLRQAAAGERAFIAALQERRSLADSLEAAPEPGLQRVACARRAKRPAGGRDPVERSGEDTMSPVQSSCCSEPSSCGGF